MLRPSLPCGENTETDPVWPMIKLPGLCVIITKETFWTKLEDASPIALARDWASCTQTNKLLMTLIIHFNFIFSVYCILICMAMSSFVSSCPYFQITQLFLWINLCFMPTWCALFSSSTVVTFFVTVRQLYLCWNPVQSTLYTIDVSSLHWKTVQNESECLRVCAGTMCSCVWASTMSLGESVICSKG